MTQFQLFKQFFKKRRLNFSLVQKNILKNNINLIALYMENNLKVAQKSKLWLKSLFTINRNSRVLVLRKKTILKIFYNIQWQKHVTESFISKAACSKNKNSATKVLS